MKKAMAWLGGIALAVFVIDWGVVGIKLLNGDYEIKTGAYVGLGCLMVLLLCAGYKLYGSRCPPCGKIRRSGGRYCAYCGKEIGT